MNSNIPDIIYKQLREEALSPEEQAVLARWLEASPANRELLEQLSNEEEWAAYLSVRTDAGKTGRAYERFMERVRTENATGAPVRRMRAIWQWGWAAAAVILLAVAGVYLVKEKQATTPPAVAATVIAPGKEGAILTLADGSQVALDSLGNGVIANQGGAPVLLQNGQVVYGPGGEAPAFNTISTPNGRQFRVVLPDGTKAWLNAASSLRYPTLFAGKERRVEVTGEVYFEVTTNADMPFHVNVNNKAGITVLGTHFNVNAYVNERTINTTLLEGSVKVSDSPAGGQSAILKPGQQAQVAPAGREGIRVVNNADISKVMAWKNGLFNFEDATLEEAMRQLERWYDIEVVYERGVPQIQLTGKMTKGVTLNDLMTGLEKMGVRSRLEGRKLIITP